VRRSPRRKTISVLPDDALLEIFKFYVDPTYDEDAWQILVHVCRKWRYVVFASPRSLRLELRCTYRSPVKKMLYVWPALPILIDVHIPNSRQSGVTNIIAALKRHDLVCKIKIWGVPNSLLKSPAVKLPFPELTHLTLRSNEVNVPVIQDSFLGGSVPRLQLPEFRGIPFLFPALGKLLLSAKDLVTFRLLEIPNSGISSPELIVTSLSALTRLQELSISFRSPRSRADRERRRRSLSRRLVLPSLTEFYFKGDSEYLEDIVGRIDAPALDGVSITFFNQLVFDTPLLRDFISRTEVFQNLHRADVFVAGSCINFTLFRREGMADRRMLEIGISSSVAEWQLSSLAEFCNTSLPPLPTLERLNINEFQWWRSDMESSQWLELLHPFVAVRDLVLSSEVVCRVAPALRELTGDMLTEVLPALREVFFRDHSCLPGPIREAFAQFIAARQLSGHPVSIHVKEADKQPTTGWDVPRWRENVGGSRTAATSVCSVAGE